MKITKGVFKMKISTKGRYALRLLTDLAQHPYKGFVPLKDIAQRQSLSKKYIEQIVPMLTKSKLLLTNRGYQGGYALSKEPGQYTVGEILKVSEGDIFPVEDAFDEEEMLKDPTLKMWQGLNKTINDYLYSVTLQDIVDSAATADDYCI